MAGHKNKRKNKQKPVKAVNAKQPADVVEQVDVSAHSGGGTKEQSRTNANEGNKESSVPKTDKGKGKQRAEDVALTEDHREPREERIDSTMSFQPLQPHKNEAESAAWINKHYGPSAQPSTPPPQLYIPRVERLRSDHQVTPWWPEHADGSLVTITEFKQLVNDIQAYSTKNAGKMEWLTLQPKWWLRMLHSIGDQAENLSIQETMSMERHLNDYRGIFPPQEAAALQWPMNGDEHWPQNTLRNLLVN
jgi:hypothetical protein